MKLVNGSLGVSRQTLASRAIQCDEQLQPLLKLMRDTLLDYPVLDCNETRLQVLHEPGRDPSAQPRSGCKAVAYRAKR